MLSASSAVSAFLLLLLLLPLASAAGASAADAAAVAAAAALRTAGWSCSVFYFLFSLFCESYMVVDVVVKNPQKSNVYKYEKNMNVVTPRCADAAAVVSAAVLRRPTKEYTHSYSMMHRRSAYCRY